jgi:hypothetical protein
MVRFLIRTGLRKGLLEGSQPWLVLGGLGLALRLYQKAAGKEERVVYREVLPVGQAVVIANEPR